MMDVSSMLVSLLSLNFQNEFPHHPSCAEKEKTASGLADHRRRGSHDDRDDHVCPDDG